MNKQMQKGFTLIELMVVIVIIGILAAIAIPSYLDNANRAKITEGINLMSPVKSSVAESYIGLGQMPADHNQAGLLSSPTDYATDLVSSITYAPGSATPPSTGTITIAYKVGPFGTDVGPNSNKLIFMARGTASGVQWNCKRVSTAGTAPNLVPAAGGNLPDKYRPANCRG